MSHQARGSMTGRGYHKMNKHVGMISRGYHDPSNLWKWISDLWNLWTIVICELEVSIGLVPEGFVHLQLNILQQILACEILLRWKAHGATSSKSTHLTAWYGWCQGGEWMVGCIWWMMMNEQSEPFSKFGFPRHGFPGFYLNHFKPLYCLYVSIPIESSKWM